MRALVEIREPQIQELDRLAKKTKQSRAALIRQAIDDYLEKRSAEALDDGFGLWGNAKIDGVAYQEKVRSEW